MKYYLLVLILNACCITVSAQNLIPNSSFEEYIVRKPGLYDYAPFNAKYWHCFREAPPRYYNAKSTNHEDHITYEKYNCDWGDTSLVCCHFWDFWGGSGAILSCKMKAPIKTGVEYVLSFDYQYIKMRSGMKLGHLDALFSNTVAFANCNGSAPYDIFSKYESEIVQRVKSDTIISDGKWHTSKIRFRATSDATFFTLTFCKYSDGIRDAIKGFRKTYQFRGTFNLSKVEKLLQAEDILIDRDNITDIKHVTSNDYLDNSSANYFIDNVTLVPVDSIYREEDLVEDEAFEKPSEINVEENLRRQVHKFSIEGQKYIFQNKENDELIETDSMAFDNARFMQNFRDEKQFYVDDEHTNSVKRPDYEDNIWHIIASRTLTKYFGEPYWNADREYFRMCYFRADNPIVFNIYEQESCLKLNVKIGNGSYVWHGDLTTDTIIDLPQKTANLIRKAIDLEEFDCLQHSLYNVGGPSVLYVDYHIGKHSNMFMIGDEYFWHEKIKKTEYKNVYKLLKMLVEISDEKIK